MDLRDRLKAMGVRPRPPGAPALPPEGTSESDAASSTSDDRRPATNESASFPHLMRLTPSPSLQPATPRGYANPHSAIDKVLPGAWHNTDDGPCFAVERRYPVTLARGPV